MKQVCLIILLFVYPGLAKIYAQAPKVTSFNPASGPIGTRVTIYGSGFSTIPDSNVVNFGATRAEVINATATKLSVIIPAGATFRPFTISNKQTRLIGHSALAFRTTFSPVSTDLDKAVRFGAGMGTSDVAVVDIDGDGKPDIIAIDPILKKLMIFRNTSTAGKIVNKSFAAPVVYPTGTQAGFVAVDDMDGDGKLDIVLVNGSYSYSLKGYNTLTLYRNLSTAGKIRLSAFPANPSVAPSKTDIKLNPGDNCARIGDIDGDGKPDMAVLNTAGFVSVYRNIYRPGQTVIWGPAVTFAVGLHPRSIAVGDMDGDGKLDIITANADSSSLTLLYNTSVTGDIGMSSFKRVDFPLGYQPLAANLCDMDGDGNLDIIISRIDGKTASLFHNTSTPGHFGGTSISLPNMNIRNNFNNDMLIQDINGDGKPDLVSLNDGLNAVYLYTNKSFRGETNTAYFNDQADYPITNIPDCVADLDGDGRPDIIIGSRFGIDVYHSKSSLPQTDVLLQPAGSADSLTFYQAVSPNGDGINDVFTINNITNYPDNMLTIMNSSGTKVYETSGYGNNGRVFNGHSNITGAMQQPGTYFYKLQYKMDGVSKIKTGYFVLKYSNH